MKGGPPPPPKRDRAVAGDRVRLVAATLLALFGALHWGALLDPGEGGPIAAAAVLAALVALLPRRRFLRIGGCVALFVALLLLAGVPSSALAPAGWGTLVSGLIDGTASVPALRVPYDGADEWVRTVIVLAAEGLCAIGILAAAWSRKTPWRAVSVLALTGLYLVPAVQLTPDAQYARGVLFLGLLAALLWAERLVRRPRDLVPAVVLVLIAGVMGLALSPAIDGDDPWIDYEELAGDLSDRGSSSFDWNHSYGPLDWPRDGRVVLRVKSPRSSYWTASHLDAFDGRRWVQGGLFGDANPFTQLPFEVRRTWTQNIRVALADLQTNNVVAAGTILDLSRLRLPELSVGSPGTYATSGELHRGDSYNALVYVPRPRRTQLETAGDDFPDFTAAYRVMRLPRVDTSGARIGDLTPESRRSRPTVRGGDEDDGPPGRPSGRRFRQLPRPSDPRGGAEVVFPAYGSEARVRALSFGSVYNRGARLMRRSPYKRTWALAQRLKEGTSTPYEYVRRVQDHLSNGYTYDEAAPRVALPLETFLFDQRIGYCQHFSGAMALLLRMGGVPARVVSGFAPGSLDETRDEYVVRDLDAHSWVEAYFPDIGWVTFDPTPADAPARAQGVADESALGTLGAGTDGAVGDRIDDQSAPAGPGAKAADDGGPVWPWLLAAGLLVLAVALAAALVALRRRALRRSGEDPRLVELVRALRRTGRPLTPSTTLRQLERRYASEPAAARYVRTLRQSRFAPAAVTQPDPRDRAALRAELARGAGPLGRLRALWALPPSLSRGRRSGA